MTCIGQRFHARPAATDRSGDVAANWAFPASWFSRCCRRCSPRGWWWKCPARKPAYTPARPLETINCHHILLAMRATQGQELVTRDEPVRAEVYGEFARIQAAEKAAASTVTMLALVNRAQARLELAPRPPPVPNSRSSSRRRCRLERRLSCRRRASRCRRIAAPRRRRRRSCPRRPRSQSQFRPRRSHPPHHWQPAQQTTTKVSPYDHRRSQRNQRSGIPRGPAALRRVSTHQTRPHRRGRTRRRASARATPTREYEQAGREARGLARRRVRAGRPDREGQRAAARRISSAPARPDACSPISTSPPANRSPRR